MEWDKDLRLHTSAIDLLGESGLEMKNYTPCRLPSTWSGRGGGEAKKVHREKLLVFLVLSVFLSKEKESSVQGSRGGPNKSLFKPQFLSQEVRVLGQLLSKSNSNWNTMWKSPSLGHCFSHFSVSAVPFLGTLRQCRLWFTRPGVGPWVFAFVTSSQEVLILLVREDHTFIAASWPIWMSRDWKMSLVSLDVTYG